MNASTLFPPAPKGLMGRAAELRTLEATVLATAPSRLALVGSGGSGKSMLACALGHRLKAHFGGRIHWFRVGAWDFTTLVEMLALRFGTPRDRPERIRGLRAFLKRGGPRLVVLDNHEDDQAMARLLDVLDGTPVSVVITARRCLLAGVLIFPVTAPLVTAGKSAFPHVASLTRPLRWNPLALDIANALVTSRATTVSALLADFERTRALRVRVIDHEDDLPEVSSLVAWAWARLSPASRRILGVLAHTFGDHMDPDAIAKLARISSRAACTRALAPLLRWHLVQEPMPERYALHAVVRYAVEKRTKADPERAFRHYVALLEKHPERLVLEQTHLFSAMDHAHRTGQLDAMLRIERLLATLEPPRD